MFCNVNCFSDDLYKLKDLILEPDYDVDSDKETDGNDNDIRHQIPLTMPYDQWKYTAETSGMWEHAYDHIYFVVFVL